MHASIWRFRGDSGDLLTRYHAMLEEIPAENMHLHLCLLAEDGIVVIDTCPSEDVFERFVAGTMRRLLDEHGLPEPESVDSHPVHVAFVDGSVRAQGHST